MFDEGVNETMKHLRVEFCVELQIKFSRDEFNF